MDEQEGLHAFGKPLKALDEETVAVKKPIYAEDQIVTDENGKRRFHGAFTGGFSAGYWNTVGSLHGWVPQTFKSSRTEKAEQKTQRPEDFMDAEDLGQFGIAPQVIQTCDDFAKDKAPRPLKRKLMQPSIGPIPGQPVLALLLKPVRDKAAVRILKSMGWKPGQGVGPRQTRKQKKAAKSRNKRELYVWQKYCDDEEVAKKKLASSTQDYPEESDNDDENDDDDDGAEVTFAPDDIEPLYLRSKTDTFGFGYTGLLGQTSSQEASSSTAWERFSLFDGLEFIDKNNKKISISGQAFGVGALEEEDEDIYAKEDLTKYDFTLEKKQQQKKEVKKIRDRNVIIGFTEDTSKSILKSSFIVDMPADFKPRNWLLRKTRFAPLPEKKKREIEQTMKEFAISRHNLDAERRANIMGELTNETRTHKNPFRDAPTKQSDRTKELLEKISAKSNNFTKGGLITESGEEQPTKKTEEEEREHKEIMENAAKKTKKLGSSTVSSGFKPFLGNEAKQQRYEEFLEAKLTDDQEIKDFLKGIQPTSMSDWDREMEAREFIQARKIYKPLGGIMSDRFVSEATLTDTSKPEETKAEEKKITVERTKTTWKPNSLLCKRYNLAEPFGGFLEEEPIKKSKPKVSVFDYLEMSVNKKEDFKMPVIIPKHIEKSVPVASKWNVPSELLSKDKMEISKDSNIEDEKDLDKNVENVSIRKPISQKFVPKTKLEKELEESKEQPLAERVNLFKSIFEDSDEEDKSEELETKRKEDAKKELFNELMNSKTAASENILRNSSPPRGVFKSLLLAVNNEAASPPVNQSDKYSDKFRAPSPRPIPDFNENNKDIKEPPKIIFQSRASRKSETTQETAPPNLYGPALPSNLKPARSATLTPSKSNITLEIHPTIKSDYQWVEKKVYSSSDSDSDTDSDDSSSSDESVKRLKKSKAKKKIKKSERKKAKKKDRKKDKIKKRDKKYEKKHKKHKKTTK